MSDEAVEARYLDGSVREVPTTFEPAGAPTDEEVQAAIRVIEECRQTHVEWADWQESTPNWRDHVEPDSPGGPEHHRQWVTRYDQVLGVLRQLTTDETPEVAAV